MRAMISSSSSSLLQFLLFHDLRLSSLSTSSLCCCCYCFILPLVFSCGCFITSFSMFLGCCFILPSVCGCGCFIVSFCVLIGCCGFVFCLLACWCCRINFLHDFSFKFTVALFESGVFIFHFSLPFLDLFWESFFFWCWNGELRHNSSMINSHVYHVICFSVFTSCQVLPIHQDVVQLLLCTFRCSVCRPVLMYFMYIVWSASKFCNINYVHGLVFWPLAFCRF